MIIAPPVIVLSPCCESKLTLDDADTASISTGGKSSPSSSLHTSSSSSCPASAAAAPTLTPQRRSIFNSYWQKRESSISFNLDENGSDHDGPPLSPGRDSSRRSPAKLEPSYLGVYSFAPSPVLGPKPPPLSPISSTDSLTPSPSRPKSILKRHRSWSRDFGRPRSVSCIESELERHTSASPETEGRSRSVSCVGVGAELGISPPPIFRDDLSVGSDELSKATTTSSSNNSRESSQLKSQHSFVHFDPTITIRECVVREEPKDDEESNWYSETELRTFVAKTVNLCHFAAVNAVKTYSLPSVKKAYEDAQEAGIKSPILCSTYPEHRALFADPVVHITDGDAVVHEGSKKFFKIIAKEMQRVLIVDNSPMTLKLFQRKILSMFPHVHIDTVLSGEDALDKIEAGSKRKGLNYDLIIVEERLQNDDEELSYDLTGSELLHLVNGMESSSTSPIHYRTKQESEKATTPSNDKISSRLCLKIGVSVSLGEDCESLSKKGGADLFWSKPPPKPSNGLRNQIMNALINKRGKSVFICGC